MIAFTGPCPTCNGLGLTRRTARYTHPNDPRGEDCRPCDGSGRVGVECPVLACPGRISDYGVCDRNTSHQMCVACWEQDGVCRMCAPGSTMCGDCLAAANDEIHGGGALVAL